MTVSCHLFVPKLKGEYVSAKMVTTLEYHEWWCILITFYQHHHCVPWLWSCGPDFRLRKKINKKNTAFIPFIAIYKLEKPKVHVSTRHYGGLEVDSCLWGPCVFVPIVGCLPFSFWFFEEI
jgi:hypothetical protein